MPNCDCSLSIQQLLALIDPTQDPNFLNPNYDADYWDDWDQGPYSIQFLFNGNWIEFGKWYVARSMTIESIAGFEPGPAVFELWDYHPEFFNLPFIPTGNMEIIIENQNNTDRFYRGRVQSVDFYHVNRRPDGTENRRIRINCLDLKQDFKRFYFSEVYDGTTTYAAIKDVIENHTRFDGSLIDETRGFELERYRVNDRMPSDVIQELLDLELTTTFDIDLYTLQVRLGTVEDPTFNFLTVTEDNVYDFFSIRDFFISRQNQVLRNRVIFWFYGSYSVGTVSVTNGGTTVIGLGTKFLSNLRNGAEFKVEGDNGTYTVQEVLNDTDIRVSPAITRTTAGGLTYTVRGYRDRIFVDDSENIATLAAILGETGERAGVFEIKMPERPNPLTRAEARALAQAYVNRMTSNAIVKGQARSKNYKINTAGLKAGWTITFNLPVSRNLNTTVAVQRIIMQEIGGNLDRTADPSRTWYDGVRIDPTHDLTFEFTDRRLLRDLVIERTLQDLRDIRITDDEIVEAVARVNETVLLGDCICIPTNAGPNTANGNPEIITLSDTAQANAITPGGLYYTAPVDPGQTEAYTLSGTTLAFTS